MKPILISALIAFTLSGCIRHTQSDTILVETLSKSTTSWNGSVLPHYPSGSPEITVLKITIPPQFELPLHRHPIINAGVLIKGSLTVVTDKNETLHLSPGDAIIEVVDTWHSGKNTGNTDAEIIVFYAGVKGGSLTVKK